LRREKILSHHPSEFSACLRNKFPNVSFPSCVFMNRDGDAVAGVLVNRLDEAARNTAADPCTQVVERAVLDHAHLVYRICYSVLRHPEDAEDAVQETFLRVLRHRKRLEEVLDQRSWIARIAWRMALDRKKRRPQAALEDVAGALAQLRSSALGAEELMISAESLRLLEVLLDKLPSPLRDVVILSTVEEMSPRDIAQVLGIPEATVRSRHFRARQMLRLRLRALLEGKHGKQ
jgi:RNA polymerase sigma-70 factor (ECF subfamily)